MYKYITIFFLVLLFSVPACTTHNVKQGESYLDRRKTDTKDEGKITRKYRIYIYLKGTSQEQIDSVLENFYNEKMENIDE